jgi:hypothetical protein
MHACIDLLGLHQSRAELADLYARAWSGCRWRSSGCCGGQRGERTVQDLGPGEQGSLVR